MPQNAKFSLDDALVLTFLPWALMRTPAARQLLIRMVTVPSPAQKESQLQRHKNTERKGAIPFWSRVSLLLLLTGNPSTLHWEFCTGLSGTTCPEWRSREAQVCGVQLYSQSSAINMGKIKYQAAFSLAFSPSFETVNKKYFPLLLFLVLLLLLLSSPHLGSPG